MTFKTLKLAIPVLLKRIGCDSTNDIEVKSIFKEVNLWLKYFRISRVGLE
jgi:hypothetical protein